MRFLSAILLLVFAAPAHAELLRGVAHVGDGDSLTLDGTRIRLYGIDAPELDQRCNRNGTSWECGQEAKRQLAALVEGKPLECGTVEQDQYGRQVAVCWSGQIELNRTMVEQGWAAAYQSVTSKYAAPEIRAKAAGLGIWSSQFDIPEFYRTAKRAASAPLRATSSRPKSQPREWRGGCVIKGNRNRKGQWIYHLPGMPYYEATRPEEIFCTEAQAQAAGYRRAIVR